MQGLAGVSILQLCLLHGLRANETHDLFRQKVSKISTFSKLKSWQSKQSAYPSERLQNGMCSKILLKVQMGIVNVQNHFEPVKGYLV